MGIIGGFDPWIAWYNLSDQLSQDALDNLKVGNIVTYYTSRAHPHGRKHRKCRTKTIQTQNDIINLKLKFREKQIFEVRKA